MNATNQMQIYTTMTTTTTKSEAPVPGDFGVPHPSTFNPQMIDVEQWIK